LYFQNNNNEKGGKGYVTPKRDQGAVKQGAVKQGAVFYYALA
jgi:hypothetical protein